MFKSISHKSLQLPLRKLNPQRLLNRPPGDGLDIRQGDLDGMLNRLAWLDLLNARLW